MESPKPYFAKPLPFSARFVATLKVVMQKYPKNSVNSIGILVAILEQEGDFPTYHLRETLSPRFGGEERLKMRELFREVYEYEDTLVDYLNDRLSAKYYHRPVRIDKDRTDKFINEVITHNLQNILSSL